MLLIDTARLELLQPVHKERIAIIDSTDFEPVARKVAYDYRRQGIELTQDYLERGILSLKQYYAVALLDPKNYHAVSELVDPFWHAHILHTLDYFAFCEQVVGGYMHHQPLNHENGEEVSKMRVLYEYTEECYNKFFTKIDREFNPIFLEDDELMCSHYCDEIGNYKVSDFALLPRRSDLHTMMSV